jgi:hypothetical protein
MINRQTNSSRADRELEPEHETVELSAEELRSTVGGSGIHLNLEIEKGPKGHNHSHEHGPHGKH